MNNNIKKFQNPFEKLSYSELVQKSDSLWKEMSLGNFSNGIPETLDFKKALNKELGERTFNKTYYNSEQNPANNMSKEEMLMSGIHENNESLEWFKSYINSEGFDRIAKNQKEWWEKRHPRGKYFKNLLGYYDGVERLKSDFMQRYPTSISFVLDGEGADSFQDPSNNTSYTFRPINDFDTRVNYTNIKMTFPFWFNHGHEPAHNFNISVNDPGNSQYEALQQNTNTGITGDPVANFHDSEADEKHSDIWGLKYLLYKEGIYDSRGTEDATPEHIKQLREKYPNLRPLLQMDDNKTAWMLNHVADSGEKSQKDIPYAKHGIKLPLYLQHFNYANK